jgi:hypothetical protein
MNVQSDITELVSYHPFTIQVLKPQERNEHHFYDIPAYPRKCVCCGEKTDKTKITRHHLIPRCYTKHIPRFYRVERLTLVKICLKHHIDYERDYASFLKHELEKKNGKFTLEHFTEEFCKTWIYHFLGTMQVKWEFWPPHFWDNNVDKVVKILLTLKDNPDTVFEEIRL